jgi:MFS family permease
LALLCGAFFMVILDAAIVTVALPSIEDKLDFSAQGLQWVVSAYALTFAGLLLLGGRAADLLGRRRVFMVGIVLFTLASLLCGLAWSDQALIGARAFQGIGAAIMTPTALSIITNTFEEGAERNKALGIWGALGGIGATTAWLIGGPIVDASAGNGSSSSTSRSALPRSRSHPSCWARAGRRWRNGVTTRPGR